MPLEIETFPGQQKADPNFGAVEVYYNSAMAMLPKAGGEISVIWQGCQEDGICYAPVTSTLKLPVLSETTAAPDEVQIRVALMNRFNALGAAEIKCVA